MKKRKQSPAASPAVTLERSARLHRLIRLLAKGPQARRTLLRQLRIDVRTFYRDLALLRLFGIATPVVQRKYQLDQEAKAALARLPFPDPNLTLGEAEVLARGRTAVHLKLRRLIKAITRR